MTEQIPSVLACDVGNSAIHVACVQGETVSDVHVFRLGQLAELGSELRALWDGIEPPHRIVACSVNESGLRALEAAAQEALDEDVLVVGRDVDLPMPTDLTAPGMAKA